MIKQWNMEFVDKQSIVQGSFLCHKYKKEKKS
jgi:hypothetical protein